MGANYCTILWVLPYIAMNQPQVCMCPLVLNPPPTVLPTPSLWAVQVHQLWGLCFTHRISALHHRQRCFPDFTVPKFICGSCKNADSGWGVVEQTWNSHISDKLPWDAAALWRFPIWPTTWLSAIPLLLEWPGEGCSFPKDLITATLPGSVSRSRGVSRVLPPETGSMMEEKTIKLWPSGFFFFFGL